MNPLSSFVNEETMAQLEELYAQMLASFPILLSVALALILVALYSYRIFRLELSVGGAIGCGTAGYLFLAPFILEKIPNLPEGIDFAAIIAIVCAILGWVLIYALHKISLFLCGAGVGFYIGMILAAYLAAALPDAAIFQNNIVFWVICGICALALGIIFVFLFKPLYIILTSFGGMIGAAMLMAIAIFGQPDSIVLYVTLGVGAVLGIIGTVVQFKKAND